MANNVDAFRNTREPKPASSRGGKLMEKHASGKTPTTTNPHGYAAFTPSFARDIFRMSQCGVIGNTYYSDADKQASEMLKRFSEAAQTNPLFLLKALVLARRSNIKMSPKLGVIALSANKDFCADYRDVIVDLLSTYHPKQLREYVEMQKKYTKGLGYRQQGWVGKVMKSWSPEKLERYTIQYKDDMRILLRLTHPDWNNPLLDYVFPGQEGTRKGVPYGTQQKAYEQVLSMAQRPNFDLDAVGRIILENKLPFDTLKPVPCSNPRWWFALMMSCGTQGLLLNTRSFIEHGVFELTGAIEKYREMLSPEAIVRGRMNPLDIVKSYVHTSHPQIKGIQAEALASSFDTPIDGIADDVIEVSVDSSGSMRGGLGNSDQWSYLVANVFAYAFYGKARDVRFSWFENSRLHFEGSSVGASRGAAAFPRWTGNRKTDMKMVLEYPYAAGYTNPAMIIEKALAEDKHVDKFIIITDEAQNQGTPLDQAFLKYQKNVNSRSKLILINQASNPWSAVPNCDSMIVYNTLTPALFGAVGTLGMDVESVVNSVEL
jgi:60 kDa SS-A/Ro ribonucleoprotein